MTGSGSGTKLPPAPDPSPTPEDINTQALQKGEAERRRLGRRKGRRSLILTEQGLGDVSVNPNLEQKRSILG